MNECHFDNIEYHIRKAIAAAQSRILIAVAWFTNESIGRELIANKNVDIEIVIDDNQINRNSRSLLQLSGAKFDIRFIKDLNKSYYLMHNKFCVIDNQSVITGSYNWTNNTKNNDENIAILKDVETAALYSQEFRKIKDFKSIRDVYHFTDAESEEIVELLSTELLVLLKRKFDRNELSSGDLYNFNDEKIKNKIRAIDESIRNKFHVNPPSMLVYRDLLEKYGIFFHEKATYDELMMCLSNFKRYAIKNADISAEMLFQRFKLKAIDKLSQKYRNLLKTHTDEESSIKIVLMHQYLRKEFLAITEYLNIASLSL